MAGKEDTTGLKALRAGWHQWAGVVELFARRRRWRHWVDPREYAELHREVLGACRRLATGAEEGRKEVFERLEQLAAPWLTPRTLARADLEILADLLFRCREAEAQLGGPPRRLPVGWWAGVFGALAGAILLVVLAANGGWARGLEQARAWSDSAWVAAKRSIVEARMFAAGAGVSLVTIYLVSRAHRRG